MANLISKVKIGADIYDIKDAAARETLKNLAGDITKLGTAAGKDYSDAVGNDAKLPTGAAIQTYVTENLSKIHQFEYVIVTELPTPSADTMYKIYLKKIASAAAPDAYEEYITIKSGEIYSLEKIGDTNIDLSGYVPTSRTIAGLALSSNITVDQLKTALALTDVDLNLGKLAHKDSASTTVTDYATGITGASYTPAGTVTVTLNQTATTVQSTGKMTPAGSVEGSVTPTGSIAFTKDNTNGFQVSGTVDAPTITVTPTTGDVVTSVKTAGTLPTKAKDTFSAGSVTPSTAKYATNGMVAAMDASDTEMLVLSAAATADAVSKVDVVAPTFTEGAFTAGAMPTFNTGKAMTGASAKASAPTFTGDKIAATFTGEENTIDATFTGTEGAVTVSGSYDKASVKSGAFTGTAATITPTLKTGSKTITVE